MMNRPIFTYTPLGIDVCDVPTIRLLGAETDRMTPDVVTEEDAEWTERSHGETFSARAARLGLAAGNESLGCTLYEVPPGRSQCPYHYHTANEEALYVLAGAGTLRTNAGDKEISDGDYVAFPIGEEGSHRITNTSDGVLRYLCFSTMRDPEVVVYPDSNKIGVWGEAPGAPNRKLLRRDAEVDYWDGES